MEDKIGTLKVGKLADVVLVNGDPLADIKMLEDKNRIEVAIKESRIVVGRRS
jgi:imidazolonepropionase-like amidohydrolase